MSMSSSVRRKQRSEGSSKKVVKKRIIKMMKDGKLVAEKEEILDEEGNVIKTQMRRDYRKERSPRSSASGSADRSRRSS